MVHPDGWLLFTDPGYGSLMEYEGNRLPQSATNPQPIQKEAIYRCDAPGQVVRYVIVDQRHPERAEYGQPDP